MALSDSTYKAIAPNVVPSTTTGYSDPYSSQTIGPGILTTAPDYSIMAHTAVETQPWIGFYVLEIGNGFIISSGSSTVNKESIHCNNPEELSKAMITLLVRNKLLKG